MSYGQTDYGSRDTSTLIRNATDEDHCLHCCAHEGLVIVSWVHTNPFTKHEVGVKPVDCLGCAEQYGPCPFCERGSNLEFPRGDTKPPWGKYGVWRGGKPKPTDLPFTCQCRVATTKSHEALELAAGIVAHMADWTKKKKEAAEHSFEPGAFDVPPPTFFVHPADEQADVAAALAPKVTSTLL